MPTYEYECLKCRKEFEISQSMKDKALTTCPKVLCRQKTRWGRGRVKRKLGVGAGLIFKGSGFYITDYRSEGYKKASGESAKPAESAKADAAKTEPKKEAKPAKPAAKSD